jgi:hypothetical protein
MAETDQTPLEIIEENAGKTGTYAGALLVFMPVVPIIAAIASIVTFVVLAPTVKVPAWPDSIVPLLVGTGVALLLWLLPAWFYRGFTTVHRANEKSYSALLEHLYRCLVVRRRQKSHSRHASQ